MPRYQVVFKFDNDIPVRDLITEYPSLGVKIEYKENKLKSIIHTYDIPEDLSHEQRLSYSERCLRLLWELLEYRHGFPVKPSSSHSRVVGESAPVTGTIGTSMDAFVCCEIILPKETIFTNSSLRLTAWLRFLNDARNSPIDAEAIRLYYAVWEDMKGRPNQGHPLQAIHLKYTRDFVSHGEIIRSHDILEFLKVDIGPGTNQYNPSNPKHRNFVRHQRNQIRSFIEKEIERELNS